MSYNDMEKGKLHFFVGLPRSGKSTLAKRWLNGENIFGNTDKFKSRVIFNADSVRLQLYGHRFYKNGEPMVHAIKDIMIPVLLNTGHDVLVDGTHTTEISIRKLLDFDTTPRFHVISTSVAECIKRAEATNQVDLIPVIQRMNKQLNHLIQTYGSIGNFIESCNYETSQKYT